MHILEKRNTPTLANNEKTKEKHIRSNLISLFCYFVTIYSVKNMYLKIHIFICALNHTFLVISHIKNIHHLKIFVFNDS